MPDPLAYFITWTTYGTWLPGDDRGWVRKGKGIQLPDPVLQERARGLMAEEPCTLTAEQRTLAEATIAEHCRIRGWHLHAVNCRSNHTHVVVTADRKPEVVRNQFKAWCTRKLKQHQRERNRAIRKNWWTEGGSRRYLGDEESLEAAIRYVNEGQ